MRVPIEWLKEYVPIKLSPEALAAKLTMAGFEVVAIHEVEGRPVLDIEVTPNRADCLSILGIAREVATVTGQRLKLPIAKHPPARHPSPVTRHRPTIRIEDHAGCSRYIGRLLTGAKIGPSPEWMQRRLLACGARPINNVVDITNYVLFEYGQPLHAFDFSRLAQGTILVRRAKANEPLTTLDGVKRALPSDALIIADAERPVAVAGVMGGTGSEVTQQTREVLLESALFDSVTVRRTARKLGLASESSYRFERGVDPAGVEAASARAAGLLRELAGASEVAAVDVGSKPSARPAIALEPQRLSRWLGMRLDSPNIRTSLARLGCRVASAGNSSTLQVIPPSFRQDLTKPVDLYEELARLTGYDKIPSTMPLGVLPPQSLPATRSSGQAGAQAGAYWRMQSLKCLCASLGLTEAMTWSLVSEGELARCGIPASQAARLANPLSQDHAYLRPSLLPGLLQAVRKNVTQGTPDVRLFEVGKAVSGKHEQFRLGMILSGWWTRDFRARRAADFLVLKGLLETLSGRLCDGALAFINASQAWIEPGQGARIQLNDRSAGEAGQVSRALAHALDIEQPVVFAELSVEALLAAKRPTPRINAPSLFPPVKRDLSFFIDANALFEAVEKTIRGTAGTAADRVELIDLFTKQVPAGKRSLTFSIEYRDPSRTLTAPEVDAVHQRIGQALVSQFGAQLR